MNECQSALQLPVDYHASDSFDSREVSSVSYRVHVEVTRESILCRKQAYAYCHDEEFL